MPRKPLTRRSLLQSAAIGTTALAATAFSKPFIHSAFSAGTLDVGLWDHWVPGGNEPWKKLAREWGDKNHVDVNLDFITSQGDKLTITIAAEAQAGSGHDIMRFGDTQPGAYSEELEPVDEIATALIQQFGTELQGSKYGGFHDGHWTAVPISQGTIAVPCCGRIDLLKKHAGLDVQKMYPVGDADKELADHWTWDTFLKTAETMKKAGYPFGLPLSTWTDASNWVTAVFASHGAYLVDQKGNTTVNSDATKQVLEWFKKMVPQLPDSVFAWDNSENNKFLDFRAGIADHEPAIGVGGGGARPARYRQGTLAFSGPEGSEGAHRRHQFRLSRDLGFLAEQIGGEGFYPLCFDRAGVPSDRGRKQGL